MRHRPAQKSGLFLKYQNFYFFIFSYIIEHKLFTDNPECQVNSLCGLSVSLMIFGNFLLKIMEIFFHISEVCCHIA